MKNSSSTRTRLGRRILLIGALVATLVIPVTAWAGHRFTDVSESNTFHSDIAWLADSGVTLGCNPPANTQYCPEDQVTREQMAAFLRRLASNKVVDAATAESANHAQSADSADTAADADTVDGLHASELGGAYVDGLNRDSDFGSSFIPLTEGSVKRLIQKKISGSDGDLAFVSYNIFAQEEFGNVGYLLGWIQINDPNCTLTAPYDEVHPGSLIGQTSAPGGLMSLGSSVVIPLGDTTGVTLCAAADDSDFGAFDVALNTIQTNQGSHQVAAVSSDAVKSSDGSPFSLDN